MANHLGMAQIAAIHALAARGWSHRRIGRELGVHRETVARYVRLAAADFFTVEIWTHTGLMRYLVLFVIDLPSRRIEIAGVNAAPDGLWMSQVARNLVVFQLSTESQLECVAGVRNAAHGGLGPRWKANWNG